MVFQHVASSGVLGTEVDSDIETDILIRVEDWQAILPDSCLGVFPSIVGRLLRDEVSDTFSAAVRPKS
jgi:hypothetical protein